jgi:hypothetical protein
MKYRAQRVLPFTLLATLLTACDDGRAPTPIPTPPALDDAAAEGPAPGAADAAIDSASIEAAPIDLAGGSEARPEAMPIPDGAAAGCIDNGAISPEALRGWLERLTGVEPFAHAGQMVTITERATEPSRALTRAYLRQEYQALGYTVSEPTYATGTNLVASRAGSEPEIVIVGGHYDTVPAVPGADDNGSGLAATLAVARALRPCPFAKEIRFVAFDQEELGGVGARGYARGLRDAGEAVRVLGFFNLDMLGHDADDDGGMVVIHCDRQENMPLAELVLGQIRDLRLGLSVRSPCAASGDHRAFWDARIPAIHLGEEFFVPGADQNPCYHRPCDRLDRINFGYLAKLSTLVAATAAKLAGIR